VGQVEVDGYRVTVHGDEPLMARVSGRLAERGIVPPDFRSGRATLEDVFLALTGREFRD
jgi:hypothetical protein